MNINEGLFAKGRLSIIVKDKDGNISQALNVPNLVVTAGKQHIASRLVGNSSDVMSHMALGTGSATPIAGDITLTSEAGRVALSSFSASTNSITATASFPAGTGTGSISEAAIFNSDTGGTMLCRTTFPVVNKGAGDSIAISWVITIS